MNLPVTPFHHSLQGFNIMQNINDFVTNCLLVQMSILSNEQLRDRHDLEKINNAWLGCLYAAQFVNEANDAGLLSISQDNLDTLFTKFQLINSIKNEITQNEQL